MSKRLPSGKSPQKNPIHAAGRSGDDVRHSKEDALSDREFVLLLEGARELSKSDYYYEADPEFVIYTLGRLGLRRGELVHMREDWIDWRQKKIVIPEHDPCDFGEGGDVCGYCRQLARQRVDIADELTMDEALDWVWVPKTQAAAREVYFGHDERAELFIERYFDSQFYDRVEVSGTAINRRVKKAAELAPELDPEPLSPHVLRATAATHLAGKGMEMLPMMQMFGWVQPSTAEIYIGRSGVKTARELDSIY
ncbi:site-specific integrase [Halobellus sp. Atlit-38R]|uniref:site-specific integrase n=1 Tax=Halobellus sp. Atlit-38R TaxID=2282131 RepID=UPI0013140BF1|nr:site-specific integrase [Halobellus sp. Atlit-38R]